MLFINTTINLLNYACQFNNIVTNIVKQFILNEIQTASPMKPFVFRLGKTFFNI